jgi:hypothetical protein
MLQKNILFFELFNYLTKLAAYWKGFTHYRNQEIPNPLEDI